MNSRTIICLKCPQKKPFFTYFKSMVRGFNVHNDVSDKFGIKRCKLHRHRRLSHLNNAKYVALARQPLYWKQNQCHYKALLSPCHQLHCVPTPHQMFRHLDRIFFGDDWLMVAVNETSSCGIAGSSFGYCRVKDTWNLPKPSSYPQSAVMHSLNGDFSQSVISSRLQKYVYNCGTKLKAMNSAPQLVRINKKLFSNILRKPDIGQFRHFSVIKSDGSEEHPVSIATVRKFLQEHNMHVEQGYTCLSTNCPKTNIQRDKLTDLDKIYINMTTGFFQCGHCKRSGQWGALEDNLRILSKQKRKKDFECLKDMGRKFPMALDSAPLLELLKHSKSMEDVTEEEYYNLQNIFKFQNLNMKTLGRYGVQYDPSAQALLFPVYSPSKVLVAIKKLTAYMSEEGLLRSVREHNFPRSGPMELFGWPLHTDETDELVLTTSELDTMAVQQEIRVLSLALPRGFSVLPQEILPSLEKFKKIVLWFGNDVRSWEAAKQLAKKINEKRCFVIRPSSDAPSPLLALQQHLSLRRILSHARALTHQSIVSFPQLRQEVFSELSHVEQVAGIKWKRYPTLNKLLKGHRRGELTVFTGPTGSGKTTFISDYSLDLCMQGVSTLWGSFEINNIRLAKTMLTQFSQRNLSKKLSEFDFWADKFEHLPMFFMTFYGQENVKKVIETMSHAVYVHDIAHVIVDNLQFMMGIESEKIDRFHKQDVIIASFRKFASNMNCHVTLVIHPRKEKDADDLTTASIFGSAKASQEADNVLILQDKRLVASRGRKYIQVTKNRFDGELGIMLLKFDRDTLSFAIRDTKDKSKHDEIKSDQ